MTQELDLLFNHSLDVLNRAISSNNDTFPYREVFDACDTLYGDEPLRVQIYEDDVESPIGEYFIKFENKLFKPAGPHDGKPTMAWKVSKDYLEKVVKNPQDYIDHPEKLDWDWLKDRLSTAVS